MYDPECAKLLLEYGANGNYQDTLGRTFYYAIYGQSAAVQLEDANRYKLKSIIY